MSFPTSPTIGQIAKLVSTGPDYIYRGLGKWDVLAMDPNFDPSGYVTTGTFDASQTTQNAAITAAASAAGAAQATATAAASAAASVATSSTNASNLTSGLVAEARLPAQLRSTGRVVTDWNDATSAGFYAAAIGAANGPTECATLNSYGWVTAFAASALAQFVTFWDGSNSSTTSLMYRRDATPGAGFGSWYRTNLSLDELDARFMLAGGGVGVVTVADWDAAASSGLYFGDNALHGPEASGQFIAEVWAVDADTAIARAVGLDGNNYVYQRAKSGGVWEVSWTRVSDANGSVWHPGNMPAAQMLWDDNTPNTLVKRGSTGNIKAPYGIFAGEVITTQPATIAIQSGTDGTIRWQALAKLAEYIAAQAAITSAIAAVAFNVRLGADALQSGGTGATLTAPAGSVITSVNTDGSGTAIYTRPIQKYVSGAWVTVSQV